VAPSHCSYSSVMVVCVCVQTGPRGAPEGPPAQGGVRPVCAHVSDTETVV